MLLYHVISCSDKVEDAEEDQKEDCPCQVQGVKVPDQNYHLYINSVNLRVCLSFFLKTIRRISLKLCHSLLSVTLSLCIYKVNVLLRLFIYKMRILVKIHLFWHFVLAVLVHFLHTSSKATTESSSPRVDHLVQNISL